MSVAACTVQEAEVTEEQTWNSCVSIKPEAISLAEEKG